MNKILLIFLAMLTLNGCSPDEKPQALGTLERDRITFTATANEIIRKLPVKEGSSVKVGEVLVVLDSKNQQAILAQAVAQEAKAAAYLLKLTNGERPQDIASAQAQVELADAQLTEAEKNYRRTTELRRKKLISQSDADSALANRDSARANYHSAYEEFMKLTAGSRPEDVTQAKAALDTEKAQVALERQKLAELTIVSTRNGILDNLPYNLGECVPVDGIVAVVLANRIPYARVYVPETYRASFIVGKHVTVHVDGVEQTFKGTVRQVSSDPSFTPYYALTEQDRSRLMYLAEVDLDDSAKNLPSGLPAQVDLVKASQ